MKVVIADDSPVLLEIMRAVLSQRHHEVDAVADGRAAWAAIQRSEPPLVLLDWEMPGLDGLEVCRRVRDMERTAATFVLLVTGRDQADDLAEALEAGIDDYLQKPITPADLHARCAIAERRIQLDTARRAAEGAAARVQWLAGIGQTALTVQHEINNPLAALLGWLAVAEMGETGGEEREKCMREIGEQGHRIARVVKRLSTLQDPRTVEYISGAFMLDLDGANST